VSDKSLADICRSWLDKEEISLDKDRSYGSALQKIADIQVTVPDAHSLTLLPDVRAHRNFYSVGIFMSAIYAKAGANVVVYDLEHPVSFLAYKYKGVFVNTGMLGHHVGSHADGVLINLGTVGNKFGIDSRALLVNAGVAGERFGDDAKGKSILVKNPRSFAWSGHDAVWPYLVTPGLQEYLTILLDDARTGCALLRSYKNPAGQIKDDIEKMLERGR
jgi:hypothetical protein